MNPEIAVLYNDLALVRVPWSEKHSLKCEDVEAIAIIDNGKRDQCKIGHDFYYLVWTDIDCNLSGHDGDFGFYPFDGGPPEWRFPFILPENSIVFTTENSMLDKKEDWAKVLEIYADPDGGMF